MKKPGDQHVLCLGTPMALPRMGVLVFVWGASEGLTYHLWCPGAASASKRPSRLPLWAGPNTPFLRPRSSEHPWPRTSLCITQKTCMALTPELCSPATQLSTRCSLRCIGGCWQAHRWQHTTHPGLLHLLFVALQRLNIKSTAKACCPGRQRAICMLLAQGTCWKAVRPATWWPQHAYFDLLGYTLLSSPSISVTPAWACTLPPTSFNYWLICYCIWFDLSLKDQITSTANYTMSICNFDGFEQVLRNN